MKRYIYFSLFLLAVLSCMMIYSEVRFRDGRIHIIFCDVGQGDAILIKSSNQKLILVDGGPNEKVLACLDNYLPFWHRKLDSIILSHPHADHLTGILFVLEKYTIDLFITEDLHNITRGYKLLQDLLTEKKITTRLVSSSDSFAIDGIQVDILGPTKAYLNEKNPDHNIAEKCEFASLIMKISVGNFSVLLTGDSQQDGFMDLAANGLNLKSTILHVPHHGSKSGLNQDIVSFISPDLAVISVGKNNKYDHPNPFTLSLLNKNNIHVERTDQRGNIEIIVDNNHWYIK